jgi:hypothetical protein
MKTIYIPLFLVITSLSLQAGAPDYRSYFSYPDAQINIWIGDDHAKSIASENHSNPTIAGEVPSFNGGHENAQGGRADGVHWRFIEKTDFGDLYLIDVEKGDTSIKAVPVLYTGSPVEVYKHDDIRVVIQPVSSKVK